MAENLLERRFSADSSDVVVRGPDAGAHGAAVYLAAIIDIGTRLIGLVDSHMRTELTSARSERVGLARSGGDAHAPLDREVSTRVVLPGAARHHGITCSMSRKGNCHDNAVIRASFGTFKQVAIEWRAR
ncbi:MAG: hypothetical protein R3F34_13535 [Planctomycetota bacterium]